MDEFACITVRSRPHEDEHAFAERLSAFWTHLLRNFKDDFERVYAERTEFERDKDRFTRQYLAEPEVVSLVTEQMAAHGIEFQPIDPDDTYGKFEAVAPDWMQIEH